MDEIYIAKSSFSHLIITAPTQQIASVYLTLFSKLKSQLRDLTTCEIFCVSDPDGCRVGSGGGTLNALDYLCSIVGLHDIVKSKIAIIHSGGDSRRAPLHSVCGKAWSCINSYSKDTDDHLSSTPLAFMIRELSLFFVNLPAGSLVIASSDVLLDISERSYFPVIPNDAVSIVTVPEAPEVAKNHGVVIKPSHARYESKDDHCAVIIAGEYLQKPSISQMQELNAFELSESGSVPMVQIDTGVVIFTGSALCALVELLDDPIISQCTSRGLNRRTTDLKTAEALRIELYSDLLHCLELDHGKCSYETYLERLGIRTIEASNNKILSLYEQSLMRLWKKLNAFQLYMISIPHGTFCHMGTSLDLLTFFTTASASNSNNNETKFQLFSKKYNLTKLVRSKVFVDMIDITSTLQSSADCRYVCVNSLLSLPQDQYKNEVTDTTITVESNQMDSFVEHSLIFGSNCSIGT
jgi:fucokinase